MEIPQDIETAPRKAKTQSPLLDEGILGTDTAFSFPEYAELSAIFPDLNEMEEAIREDHSNRAI